VTPVGSPARPDTIATRSQRPKRPDAPDRECVRDGAS